MIPVQHAVQVALSFVSSVIPAEELIDPRLEEVELTTDEKNWLITVSFIRKVSTRSVTSLATTMKELTGSYSSSDRDYKLVTIDAETGKPLSMKIRQLV